MNKTLAQIKLELLVIPYFVEDFTRRSTLNTKIDSSKCSHHIFPTFEQFLNFKHHFDEYKNKHIDISKLIENE